MNRRKFLATVAGAAVAAPVAAEAAVSGVSIMAKAPPLVFEPVREWRGFRHITCYDPAFDRMLTRVDVMCGMRDQSSPSLPHEIE
jgi:hypothetical protein